MFSDVKGEGLRSDYENYPDLRSSLLPEVCFIISVNGGEGFSKF